jgi:nucleotide-binding universal stress UspA family protein
MTLPDIRKILYCTDLSDSAVNAFRYALTLARDTGAEIHVLHVVEELSQDAKVTLQSYMQDAGGPKLEEVIEGRAKQAREEIERRKNALWKESGEEIRKLQSRIASTSVVQGHSAEAILKKAGALHCDLILMGTHEKGAVQAFIGSVAKTVMRTSRVPVLVVPLP